MGKKKQPSYRVVVMDSRKQRDGAYIEQIGRYDPREDPSIVEIDNERALDWLNKGAQPTDRAKKLLEISGAWTRFRVSKGDIHTIEVKPTALEPTPEPVAATETPVVEELAEAVDESVATETAEETTEVVAEAKEETAAEDGAAEAVEETS